MGRTVAPEGQVQRLVTSMARPEDLFHGLRAAVSAGTTRSEEGLADFCEEILAAPQGFEPRYADPESAVLPLNEGAMPLIIGQLYDLVKETTVPVSRDRKPW